VCLLGWMTRRWDYPEDLRRRVVVDLLSSELKKKKLHRTTLKILHIRKHAQPECECERECGVCV